MVGEIGDVSPQELNNNFFPDSSHDPTTQYMTRIKDNSKLTE